jgi:hypothetical protein
VNNGRCKQQVNRKHEISPSTRGKHYASKTLQKQMTRNLSQKHSPIPFSSQRLHQPTCSVEQHTRVHIRDQSAADEHCRHRRLVAAFQFHNAPIDFCEKIKFFIFTFSFCIWRARILHKCRATQYSYRSSERADAIK